MNKFILAALCLVTFSNSAFTYELPGKYSHVPRLEGVTKILFEEVYKFTTWSNSLEVKGLGKFAGRNELKKISVRKKDGSSANKELISQCQKSLVVMMERPRQYTFSYGISNDQLTDCNLIPKSALVEVSK